MARAGQARRARGADAEEARAEAADLVHQLEERRRSTPARHRLLLRKEPLSLPAQVSHPGPVWLDRLKATGLAPYGFGGELQRAVEQRHQALRQLGVQPDDPNRSAKLRELERIAVGKDLSARSGETFLFMQMLDSNARDTHRNRG